MSRFPELDVFDCPLDGVQLIEASAGTGKTWNICALVVRLLLEKDYTIEQILVVTFTNAATAELRERIRSRLAGLARALASLSGETADDKAAAPDAGPLADPMVSALVERLILNGHISAEQALLRLRLALNSFDQAAVHTIHGFCQRALSETPFAAGLPLVFELMPDDEAIRHDLAVEFWRREVEPAAARHEGFPAWLVDNKMTPDALVGELARRLKKPQAELRWPAMPAGEDEPALHALYAAARHAWQSGATSPAQLVQDALPNLKANIYTADGIESARQAWQRYFDAGDTGAPLGAKALLLGAAKLKQGAKKNAAPPDAPFFALADALLSARDAQTDRHALRWLELLRNWLTWAPDALRESKREARTVSFDDLLSNLHHALRAHPWLGGVLRERYPCALIDEFQDTDPLQFEIFDHIYGAASGQASRGPLFMVGDPKQAIYSFRAADLHTYLAARDTADAAYTLAVNQRSTGAVIDAGNKLFGRNARAFVLDGLDYPPVRAGTRERAPLHDPEPAAGLNVWLLPDGDVALTKADAQAKAAAATAAEIARLLEGATAGTVRLGDAPLTPGDIAVIVQTHVQGSWMKQVLAQYGIGSVELTQDSVFASEEAEMIERVLLAVEAPGDLRVLRAALATPLFGLDAMAIFRLQDTEAADLPETGAIAWIERLQRYRQLWLERGFIAMWRTLMRELEVAPRLVAGAGGERRLTNLSHLAELLQARWVEQPGMTALLRWLAARRRRGGGGDEAQLRLESDRHLVQIVTVHKSKGLEYAIVFCPFLWDGRVRDAGKQLAIEYHDGGAAVIDYGRDEHARARASAALHREQAAEQARLLYVALTRAVYRCYLVAGIYTAKRNTREACASMLNWLVAGQETSFDAWSDGAVAAQQIVAAWRGLDDRALRVSMLPESRAAVPLTAREAPARLESRRARRALRETWRIASFSALLSQAEHARSERPRPDHDALASLSELAPPLVASVPAGPAADDILHFPRGPAAGECLHRLLELADFTRPDSWPDAAAQALRERPPAPAGATSATHWPAMMQRLMRELVACELQPGLRLAEIAPAQRLTELEFTYPLGVVPLEALRALLRTHGYAEIALDAATLRGYMKGFIDLVFVHRGRWWIADWKSNHLGYDAAAYARPALALAMAEHGYHLQYLLYTVALHRYLRNRLPAYDYERDIGGCLWLFIRGARVTWRSPDETSGDVPGVFAERVPLALVEALDRLMQSADLQENAS
ncbi:exodeoxyribonuclease V subunit beta [Pandoraea sp.]|uniref:exodeoxyribonuclease V subunit beta n=1 Tax=Pandoraea sp. TaxID=1883445 RepID=UPI00121A5620|nr:exodeoxyribonuclease V subunit beta [Pandoraea sp.]TAL55768.1 MAG: exodeoxyribonuclease V subunit beta [Pandoraea sp.]TAM19372.1 MAG: exodeoxyribonuclease V subunit beta [Pandoraea sp.]